jgi:K+-transporting ATPase ATPase C chain
MNELRSSLLLLILSVALCCVAYPLVLWAGAWAAVPDKAGGSLVTDATGRVVGSRLVAQPFTADEYFWPRPSAAGYNAAAAGGSNWGANNPKLRDRVAQQLGPLVKYRAGSPSAGTGPEPRTPQQDIAAWFAAKPDRAADWAAEYSVAAAGWEKAHPGKTPAAADPELPALFFDMWLQDPANRAKVNDLEPVPADMVTASGAGLDPHITVRNARSTYQLDRVAAKRAASKAEVARLVEELAFTPLSGLVGEPLVNVLELNLALDRRFPVPPARNPNP